mmetsp:Transcript_72909/g.120766  ORF Transcript_72909/g.120766 Transcript_72909/m.120766 type:complete len:289 (+) Transcript_72909:347-1213(+)
MPTACSFIQSSGRKSSRTRLLRSSREMQSSAARPSNFSSRPGWSDEFSDTRGELEPSSIDSGTIVDAGESPRLAPPAPLRFPPALLGVQLGRGCCTSWPALPRAWSESVGAIMTPRAAWYAALAAPRSDSLTTVKRSLGRSSVSTTPRHPLVDSVGTPKYLTQQWAALLYSFSVSFLLPLVLEASSDAPRGVITAPSTAGPSPLAGWMATTMPGLIASCSAPVVELVEPPDTPSFKDVCFSPSKPMSQRLSNGLAARVKTHCINFSGCFKTSSGRVWPVSHSQMWLLK